MGEPPGGPPDTAPPQVVRVAPESGAVVPGWKRDAVIQFDEVIEEAGLARQVVLSPVVGEVKVSWHRTSIHVKPAEGWKGNRLYHLELLPGLSDLRRNLTKRGQRVIFSTGPALPHGVLAGTALLWVEQRLLAQAVIRAALLPDTAAYITLADSAGAFRLTDLPPGRYLVRAIQDQNNNRELDRREAFDSATVAVDTAATVVLWPFVHDTIGPRVRNADPLDSLRFRVVFTQALDPRRPLDTAQVRLYALPDTTPVALRALLTQAQYDSIEARARAVADSLRQAKDTAARRDTARAGVAPLGAAGARRAAAEGGAAPARADTTKAARLLRQRPAPFDRIVAQAARPLAPGGRYVVRVRGVTNLAGAAADGQAVLVVPVPKSPPDTTKAPKAP